MSILDALRFRKRRPENTSTLSLPCGPDYSISEIYALPDSKNFFVSTLCHRDRSIAAPVYHFQWDPQLGLKLATHQLPPSAQFVHARNFAHANISDGKNILAVADHGYDFPPFPGARPGLVWSANSEWQYKPISEDKSFYFAAAISDKSLKDKKLLVFTSMSSTQNQIFSVDDNLSFESLPNAWPEELPVGSYLSAVFADLDNDQRDELVLGSRAPREHDVICRFENGRLVMTEQSLPRKLNAGWETVQVLPVSLQNNGLLDLVTLNHSAEINRGSLEVYRNLGNLEFDRYPLDQKILSLSQVKGRWLHSVQAADLNGNGFMDLIVSLRRSDWTDSRRHPPYFYIINESGKRLTYHEPKHSFEDQLVLGAFAVPGKKQGQLQLLRIRNNGEWDVRDI